MRHTPREMVAQHPGILRGSTTRTDSTKQPGMDVSISDTTTETAASGANAQNDPGSSRVTNSYPKRQRRLPDWYQNHCFVHIIFMLALLDCPC